MARIFIVSGPSGAGKSTVTRAVAARHSSRVFLSVSATTRPPRPDETNGRDYHFMSDASFDEALARGEFLESATVHGARYGTPRTPVEQALTDGLEVLLEIDVQGARTVKGAKPGAVGIFLEPPSFEALQQRLAGRGTEEASAMLARLAEARREAEEAGWFDHRVVNDNLASAVDAVERIMGLTHHERNP